MKDIQIAGRIIISMFSMVFNLCIFVLLTYNMSIYRHITELRILHLKI